MIGLIEDLVVLRCWMVDGLEISRFIDEFIGLCGNVNEKREKYYEEIYVV